MSTQAQLSAPTKLRYVDLGGRIMTFKWTRPMPQNGYLGEVTFDKIATNKPIQVFDAKAVASGTDWAFQAQDGSFLCRMLVSSGQRRITFSHNQIGSWPNISLTSIDFAEGVDKDKDDLPIEP